MVLPRDAVGQHKLHLVRLPVVDRRADGRFAVRGPGQHNGPAAAAGKAPRQLRQPRPVCGQGVERLLQKESRLRQVRCDHVRFFRQAAGSFAHFIGIGHIAPSVVAHHRVHDGKPPFAPKTADKIGHDVDLFHAAEKTAVHRVELQPQRFPVAHGFFHFLRQIQKREARKGRVGREIGRGQHGALHAHDGKDRQRHRQRTAAVAGKIVNSGNLWRDGHRDNSFFKKKIRL